MLPRIRHSYDVPSPIEPWHVSTARRLYEMHGGKNVSGLERAVRYTQGHQVPSQVVRLLKTLLDIARAKEAKRIAASWTPMLR